MQASDIERILDDGAQQRYAQMAGRGMFPRIRLDLHVSSSQAA